jgi:hypothetical protein
MLESVRRLLPSVMAADKLPLQQNPIVLVMEPIDRLILALAMCSAILAVVVLTW